MLSDNNKYVVRVCCFHSSSWSPLFFAVCCFLCFVRTPEYLLLFERSLPLNRVWHTIPQTLVAVHLVALSGAVKPICQL